MYNTTELDLYEDTIPAIKQDMDYLYKQCRKTLQCISKIIHRSFLDIDLEEISLKAEEIFVECYYKYDIAMGFKFNTYLSSVLNRKLYKWCSRQRTLMNREIDQERNNRIFEEYMYGGNTINTTNGISETFIDLNPTQFEDQFGYFLEQLSEESKTVIQTAYLKQNEIINENGKKYKTKVNKSSLMSYLKNNVHMENKTILNSYAEIKQALGAYNGNL